MQTSQAERLKQLIAASPVLTATEKGEWLDMLILMNDKQAAELEGILKTHHQQTPSPAAAAKPQAIPALPHISNLPADLPQQQPQPRPVPTNLPTAKPNSSLPWRQQFQATMTEKELLPPKPAQSMHAKTFAAPSVKPPRPQSPGKSPSGGAGPSSLETIADAGKLSVASLRSMAHPDLLIRLQQLSKHEGYFNLLSYLEDSPLYKAYIATGKKVLSGKAALNGSSADSESLTKQEFEAFADILRQIQVN